MKAVRFHAFGGPEVLRHEDVDVPVPGAGQVRVRVAATSFNGIDGNIRGGFMQGPIPVELPHTPGIDVSAHDGSPARAPQRRRDGSAGTRVYKDVLADDWLALGKRRPMTTPRRTATEPRSKSGPTAHRSRGWADRG